MNSIDPNKISYNLANKFLVWLLDVVHFFCPIRFCDSCFVFVHPGPCLVSLRDLWSNNYRQPGLLCTPRNFAQSLKFLGKNDIFWYWGYLWGIFKHFPKFEGHTSSGMHTNKTSNLLTKPWSFKVIWTFFWARSWLCCAPYMVWPKML